MPTQTWQVEADTDDCFVSDVNDENPPWKNIDLTDEHARVGRVTDIRYGGGFRFLGVTIDKDAVITSAFLKLCCSITKDTTIVNSIIQGEDAHNPLTFSTVADYNGRPRTAAVVDWDSIGAWIVDSWYSSLDIKSIIQEIVNRADWVNGDDIVIFWENDLSDIGAIRYAYSHDNVPAKAPKLEITWEAVVPPVARRVFMDGFSCLVY